MSAPRKVADVLILNEDFAVSEASVVAAGKVGERLKAVREAKGLSLAAVQEGTKVKAANLAAIEAGDRASLPATPFTAGFVKAYAQFLGLNPEDYSLAWRAAAAATATVEPPNASAAKAASAPETDRASPGSRNWHPGADEEDSEAPDALNLSSEDRANSSTPNSAAAGAASRVQTWRFASRRAVARGRAAGLRGEFNPLSDDRASAPAPDRAEADVALANSNAAASDDPAKSPPLSKPIPEAPHQRVQATPLPAGTAASAAERDESRWTSVFREDPAAEEATIELIISDAAAEVRERPVLRPKAEGVAFAQHLKRRAETAKPAPADPAPQPSGLRRSVLIATTPGEAEAGPKAARPRPDRSVSYFCLGAALVGAVWVGSRFLPPGADPSSAPIAANAGSSVDAQASAEAKTMPAPAIPAAVASKSPETVVAAAEPANVAEAPAKNVATAPKPQSETKSPTRTPLIPAEPIEPTEPAVAAPQATPVIAEPVVQPARLLRAAEPKYPDRCASRAADVENVDLSFTVSIEGRPINARVAASTNDCFNSAAIQTANRMRFAPGTIDGRLAAEANKQVTVRFVR